MVLRESFGGDFIDESMLSSCTVRSLMAVPGLENSLGVPTYLEVDSVLGVGPGTPKGATLLSLGVPSSDV